MLENKETNPIKQYAKSNQHICLCTTTSIVLIFLFVISPLNKFFMTSVFGKIAILFLLGYTLYYNIYLTNKLSTQYNIHLLNGSWDQIKTNVSCSHVFSLFLIILILSIVYSFRK
jgi:hypothetical protein